MGGLSTSNNDMMRSNQIDVSFTFDGFWVLGLLLGTTLGLSLGLLLGLRLGRVVGEELGLSVGSGINIID